MSQDVGHIDEVLRRDTVTAQGRQEVLDALIRLQAHAAELGEPSYRLAHPEIDQHLAQLRADIERAMAAATREPPNYYLAGSITAACSYCHSPRR